MKTLSFMQLFTSYMYKTAKQHLLKIGIVVLILGYFIGLITQNPNSTTAVFWLGFLIVLRSRQLANPENYWMKGAMRGLLGHVLVFVILVILGSKEFTWYLAYIYRPITAMAYTYLPPQFIHTEVTRLILDATYNLLNICTYISIGAIIGKLYIKQKNS